MQPSPTCSRSIFVSSSIRITLGLALALAVQPGTSHAADGDWKNNGPSKDWNTGANWQGGSVPSGIAAYITSTSGNIATLSANPTGAITEVQVATWYNSGPLDQTAGTLAATDIGSPYRNK